MSAGIVESAAASALWRRETGAEVEPRESGILVAKAQPCLGTKWSMQRTFSPASAEDRIFSVLFGLTSAHGHRRVANKAFANAHVATAR